MHAVSKIDPAAAQTPQLYQSHSTGFRRATYVDRAMGSVHMGTGICFLDAGGSIQPHLHSFEESFYILEGAIASANWGQDAHAWPRQLRIDSNRHAAFLEERGRRHRSMA